MRTKHILFILVVSLSLLLSACGTSQTSEQPQVRTLSVSGHAQLMLSPDVAYISIGVHTEAQTASQAVSENSQQAQAVMAALQEAGIAETDLQTTNFSLYQQEKWSPTGESLGVFFMVDNTVYVTLRDVQEVGSVIDEAISAGANNIYGITFDIQDKSAPLSEGRDLAVADARSQAEQLAAAAGVELGEIQSISYYGGAPSPVYYDSKAVGGGAAVSVPISPGQMTMTVDVSVVYEIR